MAPDAYVILGDGLVVEYWWFLEQWQNRIDHDEIGWYPSSGYTYYWVTVHESQLVETLVGSVRPDPPISGNMCGRRLLLGGVLVSMAWPDV